MAKYKYQKRIDLGYSAEGKRIQKRIYGNSKAELERNIYEARKKAEMGNSVRQMTFYSYSRQWLDNYKRNKEARTVEYYESAVKKLSALNAMSLDEIKPIHIQRIINENWDHPRTCIKIRQVAKALFKSAMTNDLIMKNPAESIEIPKYKAAEKRTLTDSEIEAIKTINFLPMEEAAVQLMFYLGLRPEELRALTIDDFDLNEKTVSITKAVSFDGNDAVLKSTKTAESRKIPLPLALMPVLTQYFAILGGFYLFPMKESKLMTKSAWFQFSKRIFKKISAITGQTDLTWYVFRHNAGTRLYYMPGISNKMKANLLGHSEKMFLEVYSHLSEENENLDAFKGIVL